MKKKLLLLLVYTFTLLHTYALVSADTLSDKQSQIDELESKVASLQSQAKTLAGQIAYYDGQIALANLKISQSEDLITSISTKIRLLEHSLQTRGQILESQVRETYKQGHQDLLSLFFSSPNFSAAINRFKYLQVVQDHNRKFLHDTQVVQSNYSSQKDLLEQSRVRLEAQKKSLALIRADRDNLLTQTKNDEAVYQKQLEQARLEYEAIQKALIAGKKEGPVKKGDPIALVGNSGYWAPDPRQGCSTGKHLHFEVRVNNDWINAETYVKSMTDKWGLNIGSGNWDWPLQSPIEITQRYGKTNYSYVYKYSGGIHTGIDMVSNQDVIYAVADGTLYSYTGKCGPADLNIKYIDHGSNLKTFYLHIQ
ncbi:MAG: exported protein of unknown function [Microgenomates group bacterium Gr01-1014_16]|nr:MAG: exported protein of unknown function [Microgenomates group bacterium Gr01-1014_16]